MLYLNLTILTLIIVFIIDLSGIIDEIKKPLAKWIGVKPEIIKIPKPFSCSLCLSFWSGLIYIIIQSQISILNVFVVCVLAYFTPIFKDILIFIKELFVKLLELLFKTIE